MTAATRLRAAADVVRTTEVARRQFSPFVVATDGTAESDDAILVARALAYVAEADLHALSVCEDVLPPPAIPLMFSPLYSLGDPAFLRANRRRRISDQILRVLGPAHGTLIAVRSGGVGSAIVSYATEHDCELIVTGRSRHGVMDRFLGEDHLPQLLRATRCPVLMVEPGLQTIPRRVVIGLDFSPRDQAVLESARKVIATDAQVFLVHVDQESPLAMPASGLLRTPYNAVIRRGLDEARTQLALKTPHNVETVLLTGDPGKCLSDFARRANADLLVAGIDGPGLTHRGTLGSTTTHLLRSAPCSVLAVTPSAMRNE